MVRNVRKLFELIRRMDFIAALAANENVKTQSVFTPRTENNI